MKDDKLLISGLLGAISTIPSEIISLILKYLGFGKYSIYQLASLFITLNRPSYILGIILDMLAGSLVAVLLYLIFEKLNPTHIGIKILIASLFAWLFCELAFTFSIEGRFIDIRPINDYYNNLISAVVFGGSLGLLYKKIV
jgi:hypothetical protein